MGTIGGPNIENDGLIFAIDASNFKGTSPLGNSLFSGAPPLANNLVGTREAVNAVNGAYIGGLDFYTIFTIDYPESSYGGDAASREGITPGLNVRSGGKTFDYGRALHYSVYDNITQTFVKHTRYDSYLGTSAVDTFVSEYNSTILQYPDATHIVAGSHRDSYHTAAQYEILRDLGAPSNVDSIIGFSSPEWILVGEPGLGPGNAYGWVFQNYTTDSSRVAHLNVGLPIGKNTQNYFEFDGTNDYITPTNPSNFRMGTDSFTLVAVAKQDQTSSHVLLEARGNSLTGYLWTVNYGGQGRMSLFYNDSTGGQNVHYQTGDFNVTSTEKYYHLAVKVDKSSNEVFFYINGEQAGNPVALQHTNSISPSGGDYYHIGWDRGGTPWNGQIALFKHYNRALTLEEIKQNYNATKSRFL